MIDKARHQTDRNTSRHQKNHPPKATILDNRLPIVLLDSFVRNSILPAVRPSPGPEIPATTKHLHEELVRTRNCPKRFDPEDVI